MTDHKPDITGYDDIENIITAFYSSLLPDPIIGFFFTDIVQLDLATHIPKIARFWDFQLFGKRDYRGNVYEAHRKLHVRAQMTADHFHRWVYMLHKTVDSLHSGPMAELMKQRAALIAEKMAAALANNANELEITRGVQIVEPRKN